MFANPANRYNVAAISQSNSDFRLLPAPPVFNARPHFARLAAIGLTPAKLR
jgi:hypothetical protein